MRLAVPCLAAALALALALTACGESFVQPEPGHMVSCDSIPVGLFPQPPKPGADGPCAPGATP